MSRAHGAQRGVSRVLPKLPRSAALGTCALLALLSGCKTWQPATTSPELLIEQERPASVRVTVDNGATMMLRNPIVVGDSIVAAEATPPVGVSFAPPRSGVRYEDVRTVEIARFSPRRTIGLVAAIAGASVAWARMAGGGGGTPPGNEPLPKQPLLRVLAGLQLAWTIF